MPNAADRPNHPAETHGTERYDTSPPLPRAGWAFRVIHTSRLCLRSFAATDAVTFAAYRTDPEIARFQGWSVPYPVERADAFIAEMAALVGPTDGEWYQIAVAEASSDLLVGDIGVFLDIAGRRAEIGYSFARAHQRRGFAVEAVGAALGELFTHGVERVVAYTDARNVASARVLERVGFEFEAELRANNHDGADWIDEWRFGLLRDEWFDTMERSARPRPEAIELVEPTFATARAILALRSHKTQEIFVRPTAVALAEAMYPPSTGGLVADPWVRAIHADGELAGLVVVGAPTDGWEHPMLWRLLIDRRHQRRGIGGRVVEMVCSAWSERGATGMYVSWLPDRWGPEPMYLALGFVPTGAMLGDERLALRRW